MIKIIQRTLINNFEWMKKDLIILISLVLLLSISFHFFAVTEVLRFMIVIIMFIKSGNFSVKYSIISGPKSKDKFSWKFLQGLPLSKKELVCMLTASWIMSRIPLFVSIIFFSPELRAMVNEEKYTLNFSIILVALFLLSVASVLFNIIHVIEFPRKEYQRLINNNHPISFLRNLLVGGAIIISFLKAIKIIKEKYDLDVQKFLIEFLGTALDIINSWWIVPFLIVIILYLYFEVLKVWNNEKSSYKSNKYNPKKEYTLTLVSLVYLILLFLSWP